ncbi:hypothetical protein KR100_12915 [Synechococcus sp. KORDI-100]|nr:hypothetical protein KR100_12915 [Synechococcus sp. KORDI-100]
MAKAASIQIALHGFPMIFSNRIHLRRGADDVHQVTCVSELNPAFIWPWLLIGD